jgi:hypothetical protein
VGAVDFFANAAEAQELTGQVIDSPYRAARPVATF